MLCQCCGLEWAAWIWAMSKCVPFPLTPWFSSTSESGDMWRQNASLEAVPYLPSHCCYLHLHKKILKKQDWQKRKTLSQEIVVACFWGMSCLRFFLNWLLKFSYHNGESAEEMTSDEVLNTGYWSVWIYYVNGFKLVFWKKKFIMLFLVSLISCISQIVGPRARD